MNTKILRSKLEQKKGQKIQLSKLIRSTKDNLIELEKELNRYIEAQIIIQEVAKKTQTFFMEKIGTTVSSALSSIFSNPYTFHLDFVSRRGQTEVDIKFLREGKPLSPIDDTGLGPVVVAATILRITLYKLANKKTRNTIIMDEPFIRLKGSDYNYRAGQLLKKISKELDIQFIIVSHTRDIIETGDKIFEVEMKNNISTVKELNE